MDGLFDRERDLIKYSEDIFTYKYTQTHILIKQAVFLQNVFLGFWTVFKEMSQKLERPHTQKIAASLHD